MTTVHTDIRFSIVPEWVIDAPISDRAVRVYALLARYADSETLQAFPSRETLAKRSHCHWRSIDRALDELIALGAVTKTHRRNGDAYQSNIYTLKRVLPRVSLPTDTGGNLTRTTELEPSNDINAHFDEFWAAYPRKKGKSQARKAFEKALQKTDLPTILAGVAAYVANEDMEQQQFVAHPSTWLNAERWDDEHTEVKVLSRSPYVGGVREWVQGMHDLGEHFECRPGEFGCK